MGLSRYKCHRIWHEPLGECQMMTRVPRLTHLARETNAICIFSHDWHVFWLISIWNWKKTPKKTTKSVNKSPFWSPRWSELTTILSHYFQWWRLRNFWRNWTLVLRCVFPRYWCRYVPGTHLNIRVRETIFMIWIHKHGQIHNWQIHNFV